VSILERSGARRTARVGAAAERGSGAQVGLGFDSRGARVHARAGQPSPALASSPAGAAGWAGGAAALPRAALPDLGFETRPGQMAPAPLRVTVLGAADGGRPRAGAARAVRPRGSGLAAAALARAWRAGSALLLLARDGAVRAAAGARGLGGRLMAYMDAAAASPPPPPVLTGQVSSLPSY
jgi:hypothetical protein